jgi:hypothetical protein
MEQSKPPLSGQKPTDNKKLKSTGRTFVPKAKPEPASVTSQSTMPEIHTQPQNTYAQSTQPLSNCANLYCATL